MEHNTGKKQSLIAGQLDLLMENVQGYIETRIEIAKLDAKSEGVDVISRMITGLIGTSLVGVATLFFLIGTALGLGELLGHNSWGFFIVFLLFTVIAIVFYKNFAKIEKYMDIFVNNELKRIDERNNVPQEAIQTPEAQEPLPSDAVIKKPIQKNIDEMSNAELNHLELADNEDLTLVQKASFEKEKEKTIFAPQKSEE